MLPWVKHPASSCAWPGIFIFGSCTKLLCRQAAQQTASTRQTRHSSAEHVFDAQAVFSVDLTFLVLLAANHLEVLDTDPVRAHRRYQKKDSRTADTYQDMLYNWGRYGEVEEDKNYMSSGWTRRHMTCCTPRCRSVSCYCNSHGSCCLCTVVQLLWFQ